MYMSGYTGNAFADAGGVEEGTHFIAKPFTASDLAHKVRQVLDYNSDDAP